MYVRAHPQSCIGHEFSHRIQLSLAIMGWSDVSGGSDPMGDADRPDLHTPPHKSACPADSAEPSAPSNTRTPRSRSRSDSPVRKLRSYRVRQALGLPVSSATQLVSPDPGTDWWAPCIIESLTDVRATLPDRARPFVLESAFTGTFAEGFMCEAYPKGLAGIQITLFLHLGANGKICLGSLVFSRA